MDTRQITVNTGVDTLVDTNYQREKKQKIQQLTAAVVELPPRGFAKKHILNNKIGSNPFDNLI